MKKNAIYFIISITWLISSVLQPNSAKASEYFQALSMGIDFKSLKLEPFYSGYYGKFGTVSLFVAPKENIPNYTKLYWAMVNVLSKKYGCFMTKKIKKKKFVAFRCKDRRIVVFRIKNKKKTILFSGRQFDHSGNEIVVKNRKIIARYPFYSRKDRKPLQQTKAYN